jgi:AAA+ ATPase superfamily predicted ATPase
VTASVSRFVNRISELRALEDLWSRDTAQLYVLYGRRRVGKTELLRAFCENKPHVYFQAAQLADRDNLRYFLQEIGEALGDSILVRAEFADWEAPLEYLAQRAASERLIVVLDEFPYLCAGNKALPSLLQRFWDQHGKHSRLMLVLCGSSVSFMEQEVLAERSPLFGRRTAQQELQPLTYRDCAEFLPRYSPTDWLRVYGVLGGMPMYQVQFSDRLSLAANVQEHIFRPQGLLYDEPSYLLRSELQDPGTYSSILDAIAAGLTRHNEIAQRIGGATTTPSPYLATLENLRLIERVISLTDRTAKKRSTGRYFLRDSFLRFWYRFVLPNKSLLEIGKAEQVWMQRVAPYLDEYLGLAFEDVCREYVRRYAEERLGALPDGEVGRFWHRDAEIDVLCRNLDGTHTIGECKWTRRPVGESVLEDLQRKAVLLPEPWRMAPRYVLFSRSGFTKALRERQNEGDVTLIGLEELYGSPGM